MVKKQASYIIVGFGLAGVTLARAFELAGISFIVIDNDKQKRASDVAAGMFNPVVFRRLLKSWMVDELLPFAKQFYESLEQALNDRFYFERDYFKIMGSQEGEFWQKKANSEEVSNYILPELEFPFDQTKISHEFGAGAVKGAGNLLIKKLIKAYKTYLLGQGRFLDLKFDYSEIQIAEDHVAYDAIKADKIIFCEGAHAAQNPWFSSLPYKLTKGEVLTIKVPGLDLSQMINKNIFVLPLGDDLYRVGATYEWKDLTETPTEKGLESLTERLEAIIKLPYEIIDHQAGIRPVLADRRPVLGFHPNHSRIGIFNGLGTKGVMLAPYFANHFVEHIKNEADLLPDVDLKRYL